MQSADRQSADRSSIASIAGPPLRVQASQHVQLPASRTAACLARARPPCRASAFTRARHGLNESACALSTESTCARMHARTRRVTGGWSNSTKDTMLARSRRFWTKYWLKFGGVPDQSPSVLPCLCAFGAVVCACVRVPCV
jgi:hypothetical protein